MTAQLHLERPHRLADAARPYQVVLDGEAVSEVRNGGATDVPIAAGTHSLQVRVPKLLRVGHRPGLASRIVSFEVQDHDTVAFACTPPRYPAAAIRWIRCQLDRQQQWVELCATK